MNLEESFLVTKGDMLIYLFLANNPETPADLRRQVAQETR